MSQSLDRDAVRSLAAKLDSLGEVLTDEERALLLGVFGIAGNALSDVAGQAEDAGQPVADQIATASSARLDRTGRLPSLSDGFLLAFEPRAVGRFTFPGGAGPVSDSIGVGVACVSWSKDYNMPAGVDQVTLPNEAAGGGAVGGFR
jgi:hypothetical protein